MANSANAGIAKTAKPFIEEYNNKIKVANETMADENERIKQELVSGAISPCNALNQLHRKPLKPCRTVGKRWAFRFAKDLFNRSAHSAGPA